MEPSRAVTGSADPAAAAPAPGNSSGPPRPGRPEASAAVWDWRGERSPVAAEDPAARHRRHGVIQALVGALIGTLVFFFWHPWIAYLAWSLSAVTLAAALLSPQRAYAAIGRGVAAFSRGVGRVLGYVLLVPLFFLFFTLFGRLFRRGRRDRLERFFEPGAASYWKRRRDGRRTLADYERQF